jgi:hypothetical protein
LAFTTTFFIVGCPRAPTESAHLRPPLLEKSGPKRPTRSYGRSRYRS